jgi:hypothetical protein
MRDARAGQPSIEKTLTIDWTNPTFYAIIVLALLGALGRRR